MSTGPKDSVLRINRDRNWKQINLTALMDTTLSWKAKALHTYLVTRPDDWSFNERDIINRGKDGRDAVRAGLNELEEAGYLRRETIFGEGHRAQGKAWIINETPDCEDDSDDGNSEGGKSGPGEPDPINKGVVGKKEETETPLPPADAGACGAGSGSGGDAGERGPNPQPRTLTAKEREAQAVEQVLADWREVTGSRRNFQPADASWKKTREALRYGFTCEHLKLAALGAFNTPWNRGENPHGKKYLNPETIYRNSEKVDAHIATARAKLTPEAWWPASEDGDESPAPQPKQTAEPLRLTPLQQDLGNLLFALRCGHQKDAIEIKRRLGLLGQEFRLESGEVYPPYPEETESQERAA